MSNNSICPINRILSGSTIPGQSEPASNTNEGVLHIPQIFTITVASPTYCLISLPGHLLGESYPSAKKQSVYPTAAANWAKHL